MTEPAKSFWFSPWLVATIGAAPFLNQAVHVDDPYYLAIAKRIAERPLDPLGGDFAWGGSGFGAMPNPPLWCYCEALVGRLTNWNDLALHGLAAMAYFAFVLGFCRLASRVSQRPGFWTMFVAWSPFMLPGRNLMLDMPMFGFWVWAIEMQLRAWFDDRPNSAWVAGLLAGLASLTKYTALLLPILFIAGAILFRKPKSLVALAPFALLIGLWCLQNQLVYGNQHLLFHVRGAGAIDGGRMDLLDRLRILGRNSGAVFSLTPVLALAFVDGRIRRWPILFAAVAAGLGLGWTDAALVGDELFDGGYTLPTLQWVLYIAFLANGAFALIMLAPLLYRAFGKSTEPGDDRIRRTQVFCLVWFAAGLFFNLFALSKIAFGAIRHMQTFLIPLTLLLAGSLDRVCFRGVASRFVGWSCLIASSLLGFGLSWSDMEIANIHREFALVELPEWSSVSTTWYVGDPSVRYYGERSTAKAIDPFKPENLAKLSTGDILTFPLMQWFGAASSDVVKRAQPVGFRQVFSYIPLRATDIQVNYYGGSRTSLPWALPLTKEISGSWLQPAMTPSEQIVAYRLNR